MACEFERGVRLHGKARGDHRRASPHLRARGGFPGSWGRSCGHSRCRRGCGRRGCGLRLLFSYLPRQLAAIALCVRLQFGKASSCELCRPVRN